MLPGATQPIEQVTPSPAQTVPYESFAHLDIRIGTVLAAERMAHSKKLTALWIDVGEPQPRCVVTGSKRPRPPESLVGLQLPVICNLPPRQLAGKVSQGLLLTTYDAVGSQVLLVAQAPVLPGTKARLRWLRAGSLEVLPLGHWRPRTTPGVNAKRRTKPHRHR